MLRSSATDLKMAIIKYIKTCRLLQRVCSKVTEVMPNEACVQFITEPVQCVCVCVCACVCVCVWCVYVCVCMCVVSERQFTDGEEHQYSCDISQLLEFKMRFFLLIVVFKSLRLS